MAVLQKYRTQKLLANDYAPIHISRENLDSGERYVIRISEKAMAYSVKFTPKESLKFLHFASQYYLMGKNDVNGAKTDLAEITSYSTSYLLRLLADELEKESKNET